MNSLYPEVKAIFFFVNLKNTGISKSHTHERNKKKKELSKKF